MKLIQPWSDSVRILTGSYATQPLPRGEHFAEPEPAPKSILMDYQRLLTFVMVIALWLPRHISR